MTFWCLLSHDGGGVGSTGTEMLDFHDVLHRLESTPLPPSPGICDRIVGNAGRIHCIFHVFGRMPPLLDQARVAIHSKTRMAHLCKWQLNLLTQTSCAPLSEVTKNGCVFLFGPCYYPHGSQENSQWCGFPDIGEAWTQQYSAHEPSQRLGGNFSCNMYAPAAVDRRGLYYVANNYHIAHIYI